LAGLSLLPMFLWMGINRLSFGVPIDRMFVFHPRPAAEYNIFKGLLFFDISRLPFVAGKAILISIIVCIISGWVIWEKRDDDAIARIPDRLMVFIKVLFIFCFIYCAGTVLTMLFLDAKTDLNDRILLPVNIFLVLLISVFVHVLLAINKRCKFAKASLIIMLFICIGGINCTQAIKWASQRHRMGEGYGSVAWQNSAIIAEVKKIPLGKILYSNDPSALYVAAKRESVMIMPRINVWTTLPNPLHSSFIIRMKEDLKTHKGLLVYCVNGGSPSIEELKEEFPLKVITKVSDGAIYEWDDNLS